MTAISSSQPTIGELLRDSQVVGSSEILSRDDAVADGGFAGAQRLEAIWSALGGEVPERRAVDPLEIGAALLPQVIILDVLDGGEDFRWRLFGTAHARQYGADLTGKTVSEVMAANPSAVSLSTLLERVIETRGPVYFRLLYRSASALERRASGVFLPLTDGGGSVDALLGMAAWT